MPYLVQKHRLGYAQLRCVYFEMAGSTLTAALSVLTRGSDSDDLAVFGDLAVRAGDLFLSSCFGINCISTAVVRAGDLFFSSLIGVDCFSTAVARDFAFTPCRSVPDEAAQGAPCGSDLALRPRACPGWLESGTQHTAEARQR